MKIRQGFGSPGAPAETDKAPTLRGALWVRLEIVLSIENVASVQPLSRGVTSWNRFASGSANVAMVPFGSSFGW
jgi:hypothetical protein